MKKILIAVMMVCLITFGMTTTAAPADAHVAVCYRSDARGVRTTGVMKPQFYTRGRLYATQGVTCPTGSFYFQGHPHITRLTAEIQIQVEGHYDRPWPLPDGKRWIIISKERRWMDRPGIKILYTRASCANPSGDSSRKYKTVIYFWVKGYQGTRKSMIPSDEVRRTC